ncbi:MAG: methyltransferase domain-containing protein [bacterium]|nr:methyltransferase domain-containing protein [bacterium]
MIQYGKVVKIVNTQDSNKFYLRKIGNNPKVFEDHKGNTIKLDDIINKDYGMIIKGYFVAKPSLDDFILYYWKRKTQIIYPKDASYIISKMDINYNSKVLEIATGSGVMTLFLSKNLFPYGKVVSIEKNYEFLKNSVQNIIDFDKTFDTNYLSVVQFFTSDNLGFLKCVKFDGVILDLPNPESLLTHFERVLKPASFMVCVLPTVNQVISLLEKIKKSFVDISVEEIIVRKYKTNPERMRPFDTMVAHTTYIISAKKM